LAVSGLKVKSGFVPCERGRFFLSRESYSQYRLPQAGGYSTLSTRPLSEAVLTALSNKSCGASLSIYNVSPLLLLCCISRDVEEIV
jgi:hypothetical protein